MNIQDIRNAFSKGFVTAGGNTIIISYFYLDKWFAQSIEEDEKEAFADLFVNSDQFAIKSTPRESIQVIFQGGFEIDGYYMYPPVKPEITLEEMNRICSEAEITDPYGILKSLEESDFINENTISQAASTLIGERLDRITPLKSEGSGVRWNKIFPIIRKLSTLDDGFSVECSVPLEGNMGYAEFQFGTDFESIVLRDHKKDMVLDMIDHSTCVELEGSVESGAFNVTFYV